jgi:hypothetical protein
VKVANVVFEQLNCGEAVSRDVPKPISCQKKIAFLGGNTLPSVERGLNGCPVSFVICLEYLDEMHEEGLPPAVVIM